MDASPVWALLSVSDKTGLLEFARALVKQGLQLLASDSTAAYLQAQGLAVRKVDEYTGFPSIMDGRVKTLHPKIHASILWDRSNPLHCQTAETLGLYPIEVVVVNLYPFTLEAVQKNLALDQAKDYIDIGGPALLRAAAKNWRQCLAVCDPDDYPLLIKEWEAGGTLAELSELRRRYFVAKTFRLTSRYDAAVARYWDTSGVNPLEVHAKEEEKEESPFSDGFPPELSLSLQRVQNLRYGENPLQKAALYKLSSADSPTALAEPVLLQGKPLSYNNILDLGAACELVNTFSAPAPGVQTAAPPRALCLVKHTNPCGCAVSVHSEPLSQVFARALASDPKSAFGGVVACNSEVDQQCAERMADIFLECVAAPRYTKQALEIFARKKNLRVIQAPWLQSYKQPPFEVRSVLDAVLLQESAVLSQPENWQTVTQTKVNMAQWQDLIFAEKVCSQVKSNAIVFAKDGQTLGIGAGQMSRIDAMRIAAMKAQEVGLVLEGGVCASDAFFPFSDCVAFAGACGIAAVVQPGGSLKDQDSIDAADRLGMAMLFTGMRHFRH